MIAAHDPLGTGERVAEDEIAIIMFTSGTTGRPKGAMLTHGNIWWNNINVLLAYDVLADDVSLLVAPLFHIGGLNVTNDGADPIDLRGRAAAHYPMLKKSKNRGRRKLAKLQSDGTLLLDAISVLLLTSHAA